MLTLIIYNIKNSRIKRRLQKVLLDFAKKRYHNVFEAELNTSDLFRLKEILGAFPYEEEDFVILFPLCEACKKNISIFGSGFAPFEEDLSYIVF